jgi:hypothetical protein
MEGKKEKNDKIKQIRYNNKFDKNVVRNISPKNNE